MSLISIGRTLTINRVVLGDRAKRRSEWKLIALVLALALPAVFAAPSWGTDVCSGDQPYIFTFTNQCAFPVWIGQHDSTDSKSYPPQDGNWALAGRCKQHADCASGVCDTVKGQCTCAQAADCSGGASCTGGLCSVTAVFCMPKLWTSGVFWPRTGCVKTGDKLNCLTGQCNPAGGTEGLVDCAVQKTGPMSPISLFEATINTDNVNYDVSMASGYNLPVNVTPIGGCHKLAGIAFPQNKVACFASACQGDLKASCPSVLQKKSGSTVIGCDWPCHLCTSPNPPAELKCSDYILKDASGNDTDVTSDCSNAATAVTAGGNIGINNPQQPLKAGHPAVLTITASSGYTIQNVTGCSGALSGTTYTTGNITADCIVSATFSPTAGGAATTATLAFGLPTYVQMYCAKSYPDDRTGDDVPVMASTNQGTPVAFSTQDCFPDKQFVVPTYPTGYSPPAGQGVCLYIRSPQIDIPHFNDYNWFDFKLNKVRYCGGAPPDYADPLPDGTPCGGYMTTAKYFDDGMGYACRTVSFTDANAKTQKAHLCLPPTTSGLGQCKESEHDGTTKLRAFRGVGGPFNAAWITAGHQAGDGEKPYYEIFKKACPSAYAWQYDDDSGGFQCFFESISSAAVQDFKGFNITFCGIAKEPGLADAIDILLLCAGVQAAVPDVSAWNSSGKIGLSDVLYILQKVAALR